MEHSISAAQLERDSFWAGASGASAIGVLPTPAVGCEWRYCWRPSALFATKCPSSTSPKAIRAWEFQLPAERFRSAKIVGRAVRRRIKMQWMQSKPHRAPEHRAKQRDAR
ncbi:hypothetical protein MRX96_015832 [Rhipicephalus microplus]